MADDLDQTVFELTPEQWDWLQEQLAKPAAPNDRLRRLMQDDDLTSPQEAIKGD